MQAEKNRTCKECKQTIKNRIWMNSSISMNTMPIIVLQVCMDPIQWMIIIQKIIPGVDQSKEEIIPGIYRG